jgi:hypothetical protein
MLVQCQSTENPVRRIDPAIDETDARGARHTRHARLFNYRGCLRPNTDRRSTLYIYVVEVIDTTGVRCLQPGERASRASGHSQHDDL